CVRPAVPCRWPPSTNGSPRSCACSGSIARSPSTRMSPLPSAPWTPWRPRARPDEQRSPSFPVDRRPVLGPQQPLPRPSDPPAPPAAAIARARALTPARLGANFHAVPFEEARLAPRGYDAVTAVAALHHMPLGPGLDRLADAVAPGGNLLLLGLYREAHPVD